MKPSTIDAAVRERATDFIIRKFCSEEAQKAQQFNEHQRAHGHANLVQYDVDRDFQWIKQQQLENAAAAVAAAQGLRTTFYHRDRELAVLADAETLVTLLLDPSATTVHYSTLTAEQQRMRLRYFEAVPEFKALVPSAVSRVMH